MPGETPSGRAHKVASAFRMECAVAITIQAPPGRVWSLLTNAADFPRWNSTVDSIEGDIAPGQRLALRVPIAPKRTFKPTRHRVRAGPADGVERRRGADVQGRAHLHAHPERRRRHRLLDGRGA